MNYKLLFLFAMLALAACTPQMTEQNTQSVDTTVESQDSNTETVVIIQTSRGDIEVKLYDDVSLTTNNFLAYIHSEFYDGTIFHRVIPGFMIQGGGFTPDENLKQTNAPIDLEAKHSNVRGTLAMARTNNPNSATSQFFINTVDNPFLDPAPGSPGYAVFGEVISGMDVVDRISTAPTEDKQFHGDWPKEDIVIERIYVKE